MEGENKESARRRHTPQPWNGAFRIRRDFGARHESARKVLHGICGSPADYLEAAAILKADDTPPVIATTRLSLAVSSFEPVRDAAQTVRATAEDPRLFLALSQGGSLSPGEEAEDLAGVRGLATTVREVGLPVYVAPGFDGLGLEAVATAHEFKAWFRRIADALHAAAPVAALVWLVDAANIAGHSAHYPGDDAVDWWGIVVRDREALDGAGAFVREASFHNKPTVLIAVGDCGDALFTFTRNQPGVKALLLGPACFAEGGIAPDAYRREMQLPLYALANRRHRNGHIRS